MFETYQKVRKLLWFYPAMLLTIGCPLLQTVAYVYNFSKNACILRVLIWARANVCNLIISFVITAKLIMCLMGDLGDFYKNMYISNFVYHLTVKLMHVLNNEKLTDVKSFYMKFFVSYIKVTYTLGKVWYHINLAENLFYSLILIDSKIIWLRFCRKYLLFIAWFIHNTVDL